MPVCTIDGKEIEFKSGENLVEVAKRGGIEIPVFCYHPGLSVVAQCRMCAVQIEKMPKLQTACSTKAQEGMVVHTQTPQVKAARESVMEFLLINHPLDCPVCDKSGECDLQDNSFDYGSAYMRTTESRRTYVDLDMGPVIQKNMNRCIHCTRCIRFGDEVAEIREMVALNRGNHTEISTIDGLPLATAYAGNYADICPTGSLTLKDFRFKKRVWYLTKGESICEGCSRGCSMIVEHANGHVERCRPKENLNVNRYWLCDEGRFLFRKYQESSRIVNPTAIENRQKKEISWTEAIVKFRETLSKKGMILCGTDLTLEEMRLVQKFKEDYLSDVPVYTFGTQKILTPEKDGNEDGILRMLSKTSNLHGVKQFPHFVPFQNIVSDTQVLWIFRGGRAELPEAVSSFKGKVIGIGVFFEELTQGTFLPGVNFLEKSGTVVNFQGLEQEFKRVVVPPQGCKPLSEVLMTLGRSKEKVS